MPRTTADDAADKQVVISAGPWTDAGDGAGPGSVPDRLLVPSGNATGGPGHEYTQADELGRLAIEEMSRTPVAHDVVFRLDREADSKYSREAANLGPVWRVYTSVLRGKGHQYLWGY